MATQKRRRRPACTRWGLSKPWLHCSFLSGRNPGARSGFKDFLLKPELLRAIVDCGFEHPSEALAVPRGARANILSEADGCFGQVQHECIPQARAFAMLKGWLLARLPADFQTTLARALSLLQPWPDVCRPSWGRMFCARPSNSAARGGSSQEVRNGQRAWLVGRRRRGRSMAVLYW